MSGTEDLQAELFAEMRGRIKETESSPPVRKGPYYYYSRYVENKQYPIQCRRKLKQGVDAPYSAAAEMSDDTCEPEEILLDQNKEAKASKGDFYQVSAFTASPSHRFIAYTEDTSGNEKYSIRMLDTANGTVQKLDEVIAEDVSSSVAWGDDDTLFYATFDDTHRPEKIWRHNIPTKSTDLVVHERDMAFAVGVSRSRSGNYIFIGTHSAVTSEVQYIPTSNLSLEPKTIMGRHANVEYSAEDRNGRFYIMTNADKAVDFKIVTLDAAKTGPNAKAKELVPHRSGERIEDITMFQDYFTYTVRSESLSKLRVQPFASSTSHSLIGNLKTVPITEEAYSLWAKSSDFYGSVLRFGFSSFTTPMSTYDVDLTTLSEPVRKHQMTVLGGFDADNYVSSRHWAESHDGTKVPITIVKRKDLPPGPQPMFLEGYGSYEISNDVFFSRNQLSLLDRGVVVGIAHVRGGGEMGRMWYENGKYLKKENTWRDFTACAQYLIKKNIADPDLICIEGRSAGGLLIGATLNTMPKRPDGKPFFAGAIAGVPFVDVLTTMLDETIPLTVVEYEEWGNPNEKKYYDYIRAYSPVDQVHFKKGPYPPVLIKGGLHDPRVGYWEPMKYAQVLRDQGAQTVLCNIEMGAGHFSASGRFDRLKDVALDYAFVLRVLGLEDAQPKK
eukprot:TRINITY_DN6429_c0_g1_i1.p1 TRINITY_DN6429_c0_g1~~TRINITY_DN6429_c0_g1_i1.p1  ORF type:complete len:775 (+),score=193.85 TRINITY_DN6429_c0_g1_i1:324-2327(+)